MKITRFEDLECWQQARVLVRKIYEVTKSYPFNKDLRLSGQIQAAGTSVMSNIPEGFIRRSDKEFVQFLFIAMSSSAEVQSHLYVALDQGYINHKQFDEIYGQAKPRCCIKMWLNQLHAPIKRLFLPFCRRPRLRPRGASAPEGGPHGPEGG